jgi:hypothetical protein
MPKINGPVQIARVLGEAREGARLHSFVGSNFFMLNLLNRYREELNVSALPPELIASAQATVEFLQAEAATVAIEKVAAESGRLRADVVIRNKNGHKLPTAYPSRRVWLHFVVRDRHGRNVFESGSLNPDGSIVGNDNDAGLRISTPNRDIIHGAESDSKAARSYANRRGSERFGRSHQ